MISVALMCHPKRRRFVDELTRDLPDAEVVWDQKGDRWDTGRRALGAFDPDATHHVVIQDDAVICRDLLAGIGRLVECVPDNPISLYTGRTRPFGKPVREAVRKTNARRLSWLVCDGLFWGVGVVLPVALIQEMIAFHDLANVHIANYDSKMSFWFMREGLRTFYCQPSLVNHRDVDENPSLVPGRFARGRVAHRFIGDGSPLEHRWDTRAMYLATDGRTRIVSRDVAARRDGAMEVSSEELESAEDSRPSTEITA